MGAKNPDKRAQAAALRALRRARALALRNAQDLSEWEAEFLSSVEERVTTFGRAFADPEKAGSGAQPALSLRQGLKLRQITAKVTGKPGAKAKPKRPSGFRRAIRSKTPRRSSSEQ